MKCHGIEDWHPAKRTNVIGALIGKCLLTVALFECNINTGIFNNWVESELIPKLPKKSVVVLDNAAFHKSPKLKIMLENSGHYLEYLPPYSPDLNPIEHKWAQAKSKKRKVKCDLDSLFKKYIL